MQQGLHTKPARRLATVLAATVLSILLAQNGAFAQLFDSPRSLQVGALVDFPDDAGKSPHLAASHIESMMAILKQTGVSQVSWGYYADAQGGHRMPDIGSYGNIRTVYERLGNPFAHAVRAGHDQGLKVFGYFKPYEMGVDLVYPAGSPEAAAYGLFDRIGGKLAWADPYIATHPELCIQHRGVTRPQPANNNPISTIKLYNTTDAPTRINKGNLQIWTSADNYKYRQRSLDFQFQESVETAQADIRDIRNKLITRAGDPVRVLTLSELTIAEPYVLVTTDFKNGAGDFVNTATDMMRVYDAGGEELVGAYSNGSSIYNRDKADFRNWGLMYDHGYGARAATLDTSNSSGKTGLIAFARGRAATLGAPCESEPLVQQYWLEQVQAILDAGADGVEFRVENHSTHTDFPEEYGYNQVVLDQLDDPAMPTKARIAKTRGDAYTNFLIAAKKIIAERGKTMRINFELDKLSGHLPKGRELAYPANLELQWRRWIKLGLPDEAVLRSYGIPFGQILADPMTNAIADACQAHGIPLYYNRYVNRTNDIQSDIQTIRNDPRFDGFVFYEVANMVNYGADGSTRFRGAGISAAMRFATAGTKDDGTISLLADQGWTEVASDDALWEAAQSFYKDVSPPPGCVAHGVLPAGERGFIHKPLSPEQEAAALANGWVLKLRARFYRTWNTDFGPTPEHDIGFGVKTSRGDAVVGITCEKKSSAAKDQHALVAALAGHDDNGNITRKMTPRLGQPAALFPTYMDYTLSYDPTSGMVTLKVSDARLDNQTSHTLIQPLAPSTGPWSEQTEGKGEQKNVAGLYVGVLDSHVGGGHAYVDSVSFQIKSESSADTDQMRLDGMWGAAQQRAAHRMAKPPLNDPEFILADLSQKIERRYINYSGNISGRWIGVAAFLAPDYPESFVAFPKILAEIPKYQKNDGHFGVEQDLPRIEHHRDKAILWGNGRLLIGLVEVYEQTGNQEILKTAKKLGDYFIAIDPVFNKPELIARKPGGYHRNLETYYLSCIEGLAALGRVAGEARYLDQARRIATLALTVTNFDNIHSHGRLCAARGFVELYRATDEPQWRDAAERDWNLFMKNHRLPIGGVKEVLAPDHARDEGCSESDWLRLNLALWECTGKGRYLDEAERCLKNHYIYNQYPNGGAGHRVFHQIDGRPVAFKDSGEEAWWCCSKHWARATADVARLAVTGSETGPSINLMVDCTGTVAGPGGTWKVTQRETRNGLHITLEPQTTTEATVRIHRPAWAQEGATIEAPDVLSVRETKDSWLITGTWQGTQEIAVLLDGDLRVETSQSGASVLLQGHDVLAAHRVPANAWLMDKLPNTAPLLLQPSAQSTENGRVSVLASLDPDADPTRPDQWRTLELAPLRAVAGRPHEAAWFTFRLHTAPASRDPSFLILPPPVPTSPGSSE